MSEIQYVSRAGFKLAAGLDGFAIDPAGIVCADFGCNVGGFTDCLLRRGARKVYAVDTGYGALAWSLRKDERVVVMERTNALYTDIPEPVDMVVIDVAWTPQQLIVPVARKWLKPGGIIISLLKPVFELAKIEPVEKKKRGKKRRILQENEIKFILETVKMQLDQKGIMVDSIIETGIKGKGGNMEYLLLIR